MAGLLVLLWLCAAAAASPRAIEPGQPVTLGGREGVLVVAIDTSLPIRSVTLSGRGKRSPIVLDALATGRNVALFSVPAGRWHWQRVIERDGVDYELDSDPEFEFEVEAGVVNYPGDLVFRPRGSRRAVLHVANRGLGILDRLSRDHPAAASLPFRYQGHYPDPFPDFYRIETAGRTVPTRPRSRNAAGAGELPLPVETLWRAPAVQRVTLSPDGRWFARHDQGALCATVELVEIDTGRSRVVAEVDQPIRDLGWADDRSLLAGVGHDPERQTISIYRLAEAGDPLAVQRLRIPRRGRIIDPLPLQRDRLMFAGEVDGGNAVFRLDIESQAALDGFGYHWHRRLNRGIDGELSWLTDGRGRLRAAHMAGASGTSVLYHGDGERFEEVFRDHDDDNGFQPLRLSADGTLIYGLGEGAAAHRELVALEPHSGRISSVFGRPRVDITGPVFDLDRRLVGATYVESGVLNTEFFGPADRGLDDELRAAFPDRSIRMLDRDRHGRRLLLSVEGSDLPESIHLFDRDSGRSRLVQSSRPWLDGERFAPTRVVRSRSVDGLEIESYLTLPAGSGRRPLVVMPHGGPIGIRNVRRFDPEVQFVASLGYAVLQVNFRGSDGFGRHFREAGHRQLGNMIESDIDAAVATALEQFPLDGTRMCMVGASYGGYSSLISALRWPGRFRCVVSIAGFTDRILQFTASDSGRSADVREALEEFMGDPDTEIELMRAGSPVYRYRELDVPLLLAHGTEDLRVDYEHTRRLVRLLNLAGRAPTLVTLYGEGHTVEMPHNREKLWHAIAGFLRDHLEQRPATAAVVADSHAR